MSAPVTRSILGPLAGQTFDAVIFDMDGTLVDSTAAVMRSWTTWAIRYGITAEQLAHSHGMPSGMIIERLLPQHTRAEATEFINQLEVDDVEGVVPLPGAREALLALDESRRAIATSCHRPLMDARMRVSGLPRPKVIVTIDDVERGKPNPDPFLRAAEWLGVDPTRCLVVEDAPAGLRAARAAGCATLAVISTNTRDRLEPEADAVVDNLAAVRFIDDSNDGARPGVVVTTA
ncbi:HAD-IA family hydrolase [Propionibacteriaceae bacterium G1746]